MKSAGMVMLVAIPIREIQAFFRLHVLEVPYFSRANRANRASALLAGNNFRARYKRGSLVMLSRRNQRPLKLIGTRLDHQLYLEKCGTADSPNFFP